MKSVLRRLSGSLLLPLFVVGCTGGFVDRVPIEKGYSATPPAIRPSHLLAVGELAAAGARGIYVSVNPARVAQFKAVEKIGITLSVDPDRGRKGFHQLHVKAAPGKAEYATPSGVEKIMEMAKGPGLVLLDFGFAARPGQYSEITPLYRPDVAAVSITLDLDAIRMSRGYTDTANELLNSLVQASQFHAWWTGNCRGRESRAIQSATFAYENMDKTRARQFKANDTESEFRRERYFAWVEKHFKACDTARTSERPGITAPGFVRPFEIGTAKLAKDHYTYHRPHFIRFPDTKTVAYQRIKVGTWSNGEVRTYALPWTPPLPGGQNKAVITLQEYKARWYHHFKKEVIEEAKQSPYSKSLAPNRARFPDHATPPGWFNTHFQVYLRELKQRAKAKRAFEKAQLRKSVRKSKLAGNTPGK